MKIAAGGMAESKAAGQVEGIDAKVAGNPTRWHVPKWLLYGGIGIGLGTLAVAVYVVSRLATAVPETGTEPPTTVSPPTSTTTSTITAAPQTPMPTLEDLAAMQVVSLSEELLVNRGVTTDADFDTHEKLGELAGSLYYLLTGKTFEEQKFQVRILSQQQWNELAKSVHGTYQQADLPLSFGDDGTTYLNYSFPLRDPPRPLSINGILERVLDATGQAHAAKEGIKFSAQSDVNNSTRLAVWWKVRVMNDLYMAAAVNKMRELGVKGVGLNYRITSDFLDVAIGNELNPVMFGEYSTYALAWHLALNDPEAGKNLSETGWAGSQPLMRLLNGVKLMPNVDSVAALNRGYEERDSLLPLIRAAVLKRTIQGRSYLWMPLDP